MSLKDLLELLSDVDKVYFFYKDENNKIKNVIYQDATFFQLDKDNEVRRLNPFKALDAVLGVKLKNYSLVGFGQYAKPIKPSEKIYKGVVA